MGSLYRWLSRRLSQRLSQRVLRLMLAGCCLASAATAQSTQVQPTQAQPEAAMPTPMAGEAPSLRFQHLGIEDGLAQGQANAIMEDRQGFLWISTNGGLHRYDGHTFEVYTSVPFDTTSLSDSQVWSATEAKSGDLWVTTGGGLNRMDRTTGTFTHYRHDPDDSTSLSSDNLFFALEDSRGDLWVATWSGGLNRMRAGEDGHFTRYRHDPDDPGSLSSDEIYRLSEDAEGRIWAGSTNGVNRIDPETETITRFLYDPASTRGYGAPQNVLCQYFPPEEPGVLWLATGNGLVRLDSKTGAHERFLIEPERDGRHNPLNLIEQVVPDPSDPYVLWVAGTGVARFDWRTGQFTRYRHDPRDPHSIRDDLAVSLLADRSGTLWLGYLSGGLSVFNPGAVNFAHLRHDPDDAQSLAPGRVFGLYEDRQGTLWVGTDFGASNSYLTQFDAATGRVTRHQHDPDDPATLPHGEASWIWAFAEDGAGQFWVGTRGGLSRLDRATGRVRRYQHDASTPEGQRRNDIFALLPVASDPDVLWVGSLGGLDRFDTRTGGFMPVPLDPGGEGTDAEGEEPVVFSLHEDAGGILWAGTTDGLMRIDPTGARLVSAYDARDTTTISNNLRAAIVERAEEPGILWLATSDGLNRFDTKSGTARHYTTEDGLPNNTINGLLEDEAGTLWISTNGGISQFDPETETFRNYGLDDGLIALEYNHHAFARGAHGVLYFGSGPGVTIFMPERLHTNAIPPQVALTGLRLFNEPVSVGPGSPLTKRLADTDEITLAHDQNEVAFDFVALHYANAARNRYAYRLDGFDRDWVEAGTQRTATYTNLPPGRYRFHVKAANADGVWNEQGASVGLRITPPWWRTWWAYGLFGLVFAGGVFGVDRMQRRRLIARERQRAALREQELERQKARQLKDAYDALEVSMHRLTETQDQLIHSEKMASLGTFTAGIAHEIKNPLNFINNFAEVNAELADELREDLAGHPEALAYVEDLLASLKQNAQVIAQHGKRADGIVRSMMQHAEGVKGHREPTDLNKLVADHIDLAYHGKRAQLAGLEVTVERDLDEEMGLVEVVPKELGRVMLNLLSNAFDAVQERAQALDGAYSPLVRVVTRQVDEGQVEIRVEDNGPGIPEEVKEKIFEPFFTTKPTGSGTGLGLSMSYDIVTQGHSGSLSVESEEGQGAAFVVGLPHAQSTASPGVEAWALAG